MKIYPSLAAMVLAKVLLPHEENPSMAMMIFLGLEHSMGDEVEEGG